MLATVEDVEFSGCRWRHGAGERTGARKDRDRARVAVPAVRIPQTIAMPGFLFRTAAAVLPLLPLSAAGEVPAGPPPGVVVAASPDPRKVFVFSPSLAILPDGSYVASYDSRGNVSLVTSRDRGASWQALARLPDQKWSTLFVHREALYLIGVESRTGDMILRRSEDGGSTWTGPGDGKSGLLARGRFHCGPTPVVVHGGRIWRAFEEFSPTSPERRFSSFVISAPEDADLLDASNWTRSNRIAFRREWLQTRNEEWLEGNVVVTPEGGLANILRVESHPAPGAPPDLPGAASAIPRFEVAAMMDVAADGREVRFDPADGFIHFIGSESKFTIRRDPVSRRYWTIANKITNPGSGEDWPRSPHHQRNVLSLCSSDDLKTWRENHRILSYAPGTVVTKAGPPVGFQYVDWQFDGDDLIAVCRTSWNGADYHNSNFITFHRIAGFRTLALADSPPDLARDATMSPRGKE